MRPRTEFALEQARLAEKMYELLQKDPGCRLRIYLHVCDVLRPDTDLEKRVDKKVKEWELFLVLDPEK